MIQYARLLTLGLFLLPQVALAFEPLLPEGARALAAERSQESSYRLAVEPYANDAVAMQTIAGRVERNSWRIEGAAAELGAIARSLSEQLVAQGYEILLNCETDICGGFDFRFAIEVLPPPNMFVDISDFRFVSARRNDEAVSVLVSRTAIAAMVQVIHVTPETPQNLVLVPAPEPEAEIRLESDALPSSDISGPLVSEIEKAGHVVLQDLTFETGAATLGEGPFASLQALAAWLASDATRRVMLVGHTDNQGALESNIDLSEKRAKAVRETLVGAYGVDPAQLEARGIGFLAPRASNASAEGRDLNRRVEAVRLPSIAAQ